MVRGTLIPNQSRKHKEFPAMTIYKPYTYLIGWSHLNKYYYGVRYAKGCNPNDLWKDYFTSSRYVQELRKIEGEPDIIQIRKTFNCSTKACIWEQKILKRLKVWQNDKWINKGYHNLYHKSDGSTSKLISEKTKIAMNNSDLRKHLSEKAKQRGIPKLCCLICKIEIDNANFKRHLNKHDGITVFYINNGIIQKRITNINEVLNGWSKGRLSPPDETREKISKANKGKKRPAISKANKGRKFSNEHKNNLSLIASKRKLITNGPKRKWINEDNKLPNGWVYVKSQD